MGKNIFDEVMCVPATIRKCDGFIVKSLINEEPVGNERNNELEALRTLKDTSYNVYGLRHPQLDMSRPYMVCSEPALINRFGWFFTKQTMKFPPSQLGSAIKIVSCKPTYYTVCKGLTNTNIVIKCETFDECEKIPISRMIDTNEIFELMTFNRIYTRRINRIKRKYKW